MKRALRSYLDSHCHLHEFTDEEIDDISALNLTIVAVSDDLPSSRRTLELALGHEWVVPALGLHPWEVSADSVPDAQEIAKLVEESKGIVRILGEVGLDKRFKAETIAYQLEVFRLFVELARELRMGMTLHSVDTWREVLDIVYRNDVPVAVFHWYTGPIELLKEIRDRGYMISVNPAIKIQQKHRKVVEAAPLDMLLIESDAPYNYRGMKLHPSMVREVVAEIAKVKGLSIEEVSRVLMENSIRFLRICGVQV